MRDRTYKYGLHTPQMSTEIVQALEYLFEDEIDIIDISYKNDECDSINILDKEGNEICDVYLPNAIIASDQCDVWTHYGIRDIDTQEFIEKDDNYVFTFDDVKNHIKDYIFTNITTCRNGKLIKDCKCC